MSENYTAKAIRELKDTIEGIYFSAVSGIGVSLVLLGGITALTRFWEDGLKAAGIAGPLVAIATYSFFRYGRRKG